MRLGRGLFLAIAVLCAAAAARAEPYAWHLPPGVAPPPVPADNPVTEAKVTLGRRLFYDADLSLDGTIACATCHEQHRAFSEGNATHPGIGGAPGLRNVMGLANVAYFDPLTWNDPGFHRLEQQMMQPIEGTHPVEMGMPKSGDVLARRLRSDACYRTMFKAAFPGDGGKITTANVTRAIAAFERTLLSFDAPYDRFQRGQKDALSPQAKRGAKLFADDGCSTCHTGRNFTDNAFHNIGLYNLDGKGAYPARDPGLQAVTGKAADEGKFRTPSLRNVALTAPYMHDGSVKTLDEAIARHFKGQNPRRDARLDRKGPDTHVRTDIIAFLRSLSDTGFVHDPRFSLPATACGKKLY